MIRRSMLAAVSFILLGLTTVFIPTQLEARRTRKYLRVRYQGRLPYVRIYINDSYKGKVNRGQRKSFYLHTGKTYRIKAVYANRNVTKRVYLSRNSRSRYQLVTFTRPTQRNSSMRDRDDRDRPNRRRARLRIRYNGRRTYARCYINNSSKGKIRRNSSRLFRVTRGRRYTIKMTYGGRTRTKTVRISRRGGTQTVTFRRP